MATIYVPLLGKGVDVYRPTEAVPLHNALYRPLPTLDYDPAEEQWEFPPGTVVKPENRIFNGEKVLLAIEISNN